MPSIKLSAAQLLGCAGSVVPEQSLCPERKSASTVRLPFAPVACSVLLLAGVGWANDADSPLGHWVAVKVNLANGSGQVHLDSAANCDGAEFCVLVGVIVSEGLGERALSYGVSAPAGLRENLRSDLVGVNQGTWLNFGSVVPQLGSDPAPLTLDMEASFEPSRDGSWGLVYLLTTAAQFDVHVDVQPQNYGEMTQGDGVRLAFPRDFSDVVHVFAAAPVGLSVTYEQISTYDARSGMLGVFVPDHFPPSAAINASVETPLGEEPCNNRILVDCVEWWSLLGPEGMWRFHVQLQEGTELASSDHPMLVWTDVRAP
jgi:hypothetical protein